MNATPSQPKAAPVQQPRRINRVRNLVLLLLALTAVVAGLLVELSSGVRREFSRTLMQQTGSLAEMELRERVGRFFPPLESYLQVTGAWGEHGALDLADHSSLNSRFIPMLQQFPQVTSMLIANARGVEYMLLREETTWLTRATDAAKQPGRVRWQRWAGLDTLVTEWWEEQDYDPRRRPWFQAALDSLNIDTAGICMTQPYRFLTLGQIGITLSKLWYPPGEDAVAHVAGVDVPLGEILALADSLQIAPDALTFLINATGHVFTEEAPAFASSLNDSDRTRAGARHPRDIEAEALIAWHHGGEPLGQPLTFSHDGNRWWADIRPVSADSAGPRLAVVVPEEYFQEEVRGRQHLIVLVVMGFLFLGALVTLLLARAAGRGITDGSGRPDLHSEEGLRELISQGEGDRLEFKSTLRWNLQANKPGKEVEVSWLKTVDAYLNSEGGVLLVGVADDGELLGLANDRFPSDDKFLLHFNNLIKQHIGLKFSPHIRGEIRPVGGQKVFVVACEKATDPVYLMLGKEQRFYIRVGPSSRQLSLSEVVERYRKAGR